MSLIGSYTPGDVVSFNFTTRQATGAPTNPTSLVLGMYKGAATTPGTSGLTYTATFNAVVGLNHVDINTGNDATFFNRGAQIDVAVTSGSVNGVSVVGEVVGRLLLNRPANMNSVVIDSGGTVLANARQLAQTSVLIDANGYPQVGVPRPVTVGTNQDKTGYGATFSGTVTVGTNEDKTGYGLSGTQTFNNTGTWTGSVTGPVTVGTNRDKTGYGATFSGTVTVGTNEDKTGYGLSGTQTFNNTGTWTGSVTGAVTVGTNQDKLGYGLAGTVTVGTNQDKTGYAATVSGTVSVGTNQDKTGYGLAGTQTFNNTGTWTGVFTGAVTVGTNQDKLGYGMAGTQAFDNTGQTTALPIQSNLKKNQALSGFTLIMTDSTTHVPTAGLTVSGFRSHNGGPFTSIANTVGAIGSGFYKVDFPASDTNANVLGLRFTATGADDQDFTLVLQP